ncbi:S-adenosylmethionine decarboxylase family protein [Stenomitos frigidus]|uniref:S-adenosylmethionine decarboxylase family protein n=1 Tax=Stenomitos frigidus TaxID=1886765 RepID=UPI001C629C71|nr:S-adenosylmethionine decarboxylase [Stenomitos frigidus]
MTIHSHHLAAILPVTGAIATASSTELLRLLREAVQQAGLDAVGDLATTFEPQGVSVVLILKESHVALHVWPECNKVSVDIHVCDYHQNNLPKAENLAERLTLMLTGRRDRSGWSYLGLKG